MSVKASEILKFMEELAPTDLALEYDNVGLILGDDSKEVERVLIALDLNDEVVNEAIYIKADLVITHHPLIFNPIKKITNNTSLGQRIIKLIKSDISVYASHTNLDIAFGGTNDVLFDLLGLRDKEGLENTEYESRGFDSMSLGRVGTLESAVTLREFCELIKDKLGLKFISYTGKPETQVQRIGLCTGSASESKYLKAALKKKCDAYITGDVTYHNAQTAVELGISIIDGTHFNTEIIVVPRLAEYLENKFGKADIEIVKSNAGKSILNVL